MDYGFNARLHKQFINSRTEHNFWRRGCDKVMERDVPTWTDSPRSLAKMGASFFEWLDASVCSVAA